MSPNIGVLTLGSNTKLHIPPYKPNAITEVIQKGVFTNTELSHPGTAMPGHIQQTFTALAKDSVLNNDNKASLNQQTQLVLDV